ncbi:hypothetical protein PV703_12670 [Streptomyces sp. ME01-24h]|nr:hypothetical protein [Streptomyces sp. ME01-24h]
MLETVGLTAAEAEVYRLLLATESASAEEISARADLGPLSGPGCPRQPTLSTTVRADGIAPGR